jgi:hypothetical protein
LPAKAPVVRFRYPHGFDSHRVETEQIRAEIEFNEAAKGVDPFELQDLHTNRILRIFRVFGAELCACAHEGKLGIGRARELAEDFVDAHLTEAELDRDEDLDEIHERLEWKQFLHELAKPIEGPYTEPARSEPTNGLVPHADFFDAKEQREAAIEAATREHHRVDAVAGLCGVDYHDLRRWARDRGKALAKGKSTKIERIEKTLSPWACVGASSRNGQEPQ